MAQKKQKKKS